MARMLTALANSNSCKIASICSRPAKEQIVLEEMDHLVKGSKTRTNNA